MNPASSATHDPSRSPDGSPLRPRLYTPGFSDVLGDRRLMLENTNSTMAEQLRFKREFSEAVGFEVAIRQRIEELGQLHDPSIGTVRRVEWLGANEGLALVSNHVGGRRLSDMIGEAAGPAFAFEFIRQLAPALAAIQGQGGGIAHGVLSAERIIVTRDGRLVIVEHVLGSAFELLQLPANRLRSEFGLALPIGDEQVTLDQRLDVIQLGFIALSLLAGTRLDPNQYPDEIPSLLETHARVDSLASAQLRLWLEGALQLNRRPFDRPFDTAQDAYEAFEELSHELGPHTTEPERVVVPFNAPGEQDLVQEHEPELETEPEPELEATAEIESEPEHPAVAAGPAGATDLDLLGRRVVQRDQALGVQRKPTIFLPLGGSAKALRNLTPTTIRIALAGVTVVVLVVLLIVFKPFSSGTPLPPVQTVTQTTPPSVPAPAVPEPTFVGPMPDPIRMAGLAASVPDASATATAKPAEPTPAAHPPAAEAPTPAAPTGRFGGVRITSPIEFQVFENGNLVGSTTGPIAVMDGNHTFDLVNEMLGYRTRQTVNVKPGQMSAVSITVPNGRVSINAVPWADVWVDGKSVGQTPIANLSLPIGPHEIVFRHPQFPDQRQTWMVKAEGTTMVSAKFQQ
jgi:PEGA domain-containing protein